MCLPKPSGLSVFLFLWMLCADKNTRVQHHWYVKESSKTMLCPPIAFPEMKVFDCHFCGPSRLLKPFWLNAPLGCCCNTRNRISDLSCYWFEFLKGCDASVGCPQNVVPLVPVHLLAMQNWRVHVLCDSPFSRSIISNHRLSRVGIKGLIVFLGTGSPLHLSSSSPLYNIARYECNCPPDFHCGR